ncbi:MAG: winged helix DNA-binding protein [Rhodobacter sp.]|uniref:MarR family winged helix-turn-helix transcriptional regulator n=1 Tax=Pararhodobacter sp. TaxID=2127056 RepID=UPI001DEEB829|nr:MarR family transcriptional regulator [Pararhodobacter sp.]MCB1344046.1 winged helix DNA-binding protein [Paracoccaceae bacterium]MCC0074724.1 winged helix DNA-binding protein [Rhodobacter sp.]HPD92304.1 MarR family transcriptional regulator [Pararhodobacter sp.]
MSDPAAIPPTPTPPLSQAGAASRAGEPPCHSAELLVHLARLVHGGETDTSLTPAQWTALRYFASANRFSRTPTAFSEFHATTKGTASQTVKSLIGLGLLQRRAHDSDGRSALIEVTEAGQDKLRRDPLADLTRCIRALPDARRREFLSTLTELGGALARMRTAPTFGKCGDCGHCDTSGGAGAYCRCTQEMLDGTEMQSICVDFAQGAPRLR